MNRILSLTIICIVFSLLSAKQSTLSAQGTLQFNRVILLVDTSGVQTVPAGKVWKVTYVNSSTARRVSSYSQNCCTGWWSATNPSPCSGATSGSSTASSINYANCPSGNNAFLVNGQRIAFGGGNPLWLPAGIQVEVTGTPCRNSANINAGNEVFVNNTDNYWFCGPFSVSVSTPIQNSPMVSIIEFNILP
jgi:hypothetical protein